MPTAQKEAAVAELKELVQNATIVISAEYRGLSVKEMTALRRALRQSGVEARVVKNKLFQRAATEAGIEAAGAVVEGPSLVIFGYGDIVSPAKAVADYQRTARNAFAAKKAYFDGEVVGPSVISDLATLPSREELIGKLAGAFVSPLQNFVFLLNDTITGFARLVDARAAQLENEAAA
jgi:large subunit ribosomal protein L10